MGRGGKTNQTGVNRHTPSYSSDVAEVAGGSGPARDMAQSCMIEFAEEVMLDGPSANGAKTDLAVMFVAGVPGTINIISGGARLGVYDGELKTHLLRCMRKKYVYRGKIGATRTSDGKVYAVCEMQGLGLK